MPPGDRSCASSSLCLLPSGIHSLFDTVGGCQSRDTLSEFVSAAMAMTISEVAALLANRSGADTTISSATRLSRSLCPMPDEADAEDEHAGGQQYCAHIGEIDEPVRGRGSGDSTDRKRAAGTRIAAMGIDPRTSHFKTLDRLASST